MGLTGEAKREYQKKYMAQKRSNKGTDVVVLSDRQEFIPDPEVKKAIKKAFNDNIEYMGNLRGDPEERKAVAKRYPEALSLAEKLCNPSWLSFIKYMAENLRAEYCESLRIGMSGPSIADLKPLLGKV